MARQRGRLAWAKPLTGSDRQIKAATTKKAKAHDESILALSKYGIKPPTHIVETEGGFAAAKKGAPGAVPSSSKLSDRPEGPLPKVEVPEELQRTSTTLGGLPDASARTKVLRKPRQEAMVRSRRSFTKANPARFRVLSDVQPEVAGMKPGEAYEHLGWHEAEGERVEFHPGDKSDDPTHLERPPRWEELHPKVQRRILDRALDFGVTPQSARHAFSTQLDRAMAREGGRHASFYEAGGYSDVGNELPLQRLLSTVERHDVPMEAVAGANAITSPQAAFSHTNKTTGETKYPNADAAEMAIAAAKRGLSGEQFREEYKQGKWGTTQSFVGNVARAVDVVRQIGKPLLEPVDRDIDPGTAHLRDVWSPGTRPGGGAGDKVRAYVNAWLAPRKSEGQYFVSDIHSGGHGMAPHLNKAQHTDYLGIAGIHAFHDKIVRDVLAERGLTNVSRAQSAQWSQNKHEMDKTGTGAEAVAAMVQTHRSTDAARPAPHWSGE